MSELREKATQDARVESLKEKNAELFAGTFNSKLKILETMLDGLRSEMKLLKESIDRANGQYDKFDSFIASLKNFILNKDTRLKNMETEIVKINEDIIMIKGKKNGHSS
jgi:chromosome segregation ATPase